jgi:D-glycero-D-manno-heptose 1,7-bisphosphate phosphatase
MLLEAEKEFNLDLNNSYIVGDRTSDIECGQAANLKNCFFLDYNYDERKPNKPFIKINSLYDLMYHIT